MKRRGKWMIAAVLAALCTAAAPTISFAWGVKSAGQAETKAEEGYCFKKGEVTVAMGAEAAPVIKALGDPVKPVFEQDSCAYQGKDKVYTYEGFEISTYPVNGTDCIASVYFISDKAQTPEGIGIGSTAKEAIKAYGADYKEEFGVYRYKKGNSELIIYTANQVVDAVEYNVAAK